VNINYVDCSWCDFLNVNSITSSKDIELVCECINWEPTENKYSVFLDSNEPDIIFQTTANDVLQKSKLFDLIVTRRSELLHLPNAVCVPFGTTYIADKNRLSELDKTPSVSYTMTSKFNPEAQGYQLRYQILETWEKIKSICELPVYFYESQMAPLGIFDLKLPIGCRDVLMEHMFHVAVENTLHDNYFTEKLVDCLITKTVPIYYGCPNISEYFNTDGIIIVNSCSELHEVLSNLSVEDYYKRKDALEENLLLAQKYITFTDRVEEKIQTMINEKENIK